MEEQLSAQDVEKYSGEFAHLTNDCVRSFSWEGVNATVQDRQTKSPKSILSDINGIVKAGELLALMGPSGSGKTTLLNILARRAPSSGLNVKETLCVNGTNVSLGQFRKLSSYVEQEDALLGALTVKETLYFAAKLSLPSSVGHHERLARIQDLLASFGLQKQADTLIGTPIRKGISGGQKRRVSCASQLITSPRILFLDEPTSGLDSAASYEVISFVRNIAKRHNLLVIASIHQPSTATFDLFDKLLLLSEGKTAYNGPVPKVRDYFDSLGFTMPLYTNPAEFIIDLINTDFSRDQEVAHQQLDRIQNSWNLSEAASSVTKEISHANSRADTASQLGGEQGTANSFTVSLTLIHRSFLKSYRDVVAYGIRIAMYMGLAIMMGTVWLRLSTTQDNIQSFINAIFFGGAFMSFMAVAYIPSFLEDRSLFIKERANGLYGPTSFMVANFVTGVPYLFLITMLFSITAYWLSNFRSSGSAFFYWVMWLFLDLLAAESLVVLISSLVPIFVVALAAVAFANGLWMCVGGFLVQPQTLNVFWRYVFHYIDYQAYVFQGMMVNEFAERTYSCSDDCQCMYVTELADHCRIAGTGVLRNYGYRTDRIGEWVGILISIILGYRLLGLLVLHLRRT
ncbi:putative ABC transporter [Patellaria atrata CBS 101060]|uniref:ABC transporter n=1 Tax=Patellaria atrata CBS 101060 TaxID=1346257 RepID=A0A9P4S9P0_9PEZI|nr:putative ABC transporter [Patellaria atrata CBS 101060]